ncbi:hypothetical protein STCU_06572 [Strigomonas culicis]|uniref:Sulfhydryl oxidase n=1 Tax=Strigomonas culicis TaxID=28005 RepID=S9VF64_9TRYP|nr:hypothetical protein STCU_06572 [Strigomonas culicis]|eukprot:EPY25671.1 hypothetical protein STCU_06572 [Strigomonas culicis]
MDIEGKCPTPVQLGNSGWDILHSSAAVYPNHPNPEQQEAMRGFLHGMSYVYACNWCAYHMRLYMREHPPDVRDKRHVSRYVCELHNEVNARLGKEQVSCEPEVLLKRWHPGYPDRMEDRPTMEEQVAAAQAKQERERREAAQAQEEAEAQRRRMLFQRGETPRSGDSWRQWERQGEAGGAQHERAAAAPRTDPTAPSTNQSRAAGGSSSKWWGFGGGDSKRIRDPPPANPSAAVKAGGGSSGGGKVADTETDVESVLARLKRCQVYCPEEDQK